MPIRDVLDRLEDAERRFVGAEFFAPVIGDGRVSVRVAGVVCRLQVVAGLPAKFQGYAILRARSTRAAEFLRAATLAERAQYLALFPAVRLILVARERETWWAMPAQLGDRRIRLEGPAVLQLAEEGLERFETVLARCDGQLFWYERRDPARNPALGAYLREQMAQTDARGLPPAVETLHMPGLSREEQEAYALVRTSIAEAQRDRVEARLAEALAHAAAQLHSYQERDNAYVVTYAVDGRRYTSVVRRDDLTVMTAGICLSGQDRRFDLASLVGVLRQGEANGRLVRVGYEEQD